MIRLLARIAFVLFAIMCLTAPAGGIKCGGGGAAGGKVGRAGVGNNTGGNPAMRVVVSAANATKAIALAVTAVQEARAATLDVEKKQLEIEALKTKEAGGYWVDVRADLNDEQVGKIKEEKKVTIQLDDGTESELPVRIK